MAVAQFGPRVDAYRSEVDYPYNVQLGDLDGDGDQDILVVLGGNVYSWKNDGAGNFGPRELLLAASLNMTSLLQLIDVDGDGITDLMAAGQWYAGSGGGAYGTTGVSTGSGGWDLVADVDGDGDPDLLTKYGYGLRLSINDGSGNFSPGQTIGTTVANSFTSMYADFKDVNGDALPDLVVGGECAQRGWYANLGGGVFGPANTVAGLTNTKGMLCGDVDGDGDNDIVRTLTSGTPKLSWLANDGLGNFTLADTISMGGYGDANLAADVDGDGDLDLAVNTGTSCNVRWWLNTGAGYTWTEQAVEDFGGYSLQGTRYAVGDIDGDGDPDLLATHGLGVMGWYANLGNGMWGPRNRACSCMGAANDVSAADIDLDGDLDLVASAYYGRQVTWYANNGDGTFGTQQVVREHMEGVSAARTVDLDADGLPDILTDKSDAAILWNNNGGSSWTADTLPGLGVSRAEADLDGDLDIDLVGSGGWYENDGSGHFSWHANPLIPAGQVKVGDMNGDGIPDLIIGTSTSWTILLNDGSMGLTSLSGSGTLNSFDLGDVDGDGDLDAYAMGYLLEIRGYFNDGSGNLTEQLLYTGGAGFTRTIRVLDINGDNYPDAVWAMSNGYTHQTSYNLNLGNGQLGPQTLIDPTSESAADLLLADLNNDAVPDLVTARFHSIIWQENFFFNAFRMKGSVFLDFDLDATLDPTDQKVPYCLVRTDANNVLVWTNSAGDYDLPADTGTWHAWHMHASYYQITNDPDTLTATLTAQAPIVTGLDFGLAPATEDTTISINTTFSNQSCNTEQVLWMNVVNSGTSIALGITIDLFVDPDLTIISTYPPADSISAGHVYWHVDSLGWFQRFRGAVRFLVGPAGTMAGIGYEVNSSNLGLIQSVPLANTAVSCSFDPNDIRVEPQGYGTAGAIPVSTEWLEYTIRFQNTGNDTAFTVQLLDTLDNNLDPRTMEVLAASHALTQIQVDPNNVALFRFQRILLPDSIVDEPGSHGYVKYRIKPVAGLPDGTEITNSAGIYFDLNEPVITNTVLNTLVDCNLFTATITAVDMDELQANAGDAYQWFINGVAIPGATSADLTLTATGEYTVQVTSSFGCQALSEPYTFIGTHIVEVTNDDLSVVPNPASSIIVLHSAQPLTDDLRIRLLDLSGRTLLTMHGNGTKKLEIQRGQLASGLYVLQVKLSQEEGRMLRVMLQ